MYNVHGIQVHRCNQNRTILYIHLFFFHLVNKMTTWSILELNNFFSLCKAKIHAIHFNLNSSHMKEILNIGNALRAVKPFTIYVIMYMIHYFWYGKTEGEQSTKTHRSHAHAVQTIKHVILRNACIQHTAYENGKNRSCQAKSTNHR